MFTDRIGEDYAPLTELCFYLFWNQSKFPWKKLYGCGELTHVINIFFYPGLKKKDRVILIKYISHA